MMAFAMVFSLLVKYSIPSALYGASLAWSITSVAAWCVRRKMRSVRRRHRQIKCEPPDRFTELLRSKNDRHQAAGEIFSLTPFAQRHRVELNVRSVRKRDDLVVIELFDPH